MAASAATPHGRTQDAPVAAPNVWPDDPHAWYPDVPIGSELEPVKALVSDDLVERYVVATGGSAGHTDARTGRRVAPTCIAEQLGLGMMTTRAPDKPPGGSVHAASQFHHLAPIIVGSELLARGRVVDRYVRRGKFYFVFETTVSDDAGRDVLRARYWQVRMPRPNQTRAVATAGAPDERSDRHGPLLDDCLRGRTPSFTLKRQFTRAMMELFSTWPLRPNDGDRRRTQHTDDSVAREWGRPGAILQALQTTSLIEELAASGLGTAYLSGGSCTIRYTSLVLPDDTLTVHALVPDVAPSREVELEIICATQRRDVVAVGSARLGGLPDDTDLDSQRVEGSGEAD